MRMRGDEKRLAKGDKGVRIMMRVVEDSRLV